jgi:hypothetical protein
MNGQASTQELFFTYRPPFSNDQLQQGDILHRSPALKEILSDIHKYYSIKDDYTHFLVLTQSCDLIKRDGNPCKAKYITLAAVRPLTLVMKREIEKYQLDGLAQKANVCGNRNRQKVHEFVGRLLNNNESEFFYLHAEAANNFPNASCAFLRLSVSIKIEHYTECLDARILSLSEIFQAKLGWLVGNMYSRVGTEEWLPRYTQDQFTRTVRDILDATCKWVDDDKLKEAGKTTLDLDSKTFHELRQIVEDARIESRRDQITAAISEELNLIGTIATPDDRRRFLGRLAANEVFKSQTKK